jgi:hypothetical protein
VSGRLENSHLATGLEQIALLVLVAQQSDVLSKNCFKVSSGVRPSPENAEWGEVHVMIFSTYEAT